MQEGKEQRMSNKEHDFQVPLQLMYEIRGCRQFQDTQFSGWRCLEHWNVNGPVFRQLR